MFISLLGRIPRTSFVPTTLASKSSVATFVPTQVWLRLPAGAGISPVTGDSVESVTARRALNGHRHDGESPVFGPPRSSTLADHGLLDGALFTDR